MVRHDGTYPTADLRQDFFNVAVVQTRVHGVDGDNPEPDRRANLDYTPTSNQAAYRYFKEHARWVHYW